MAVQINQNLGLTTAFEDDSDCYVTRSSVYEDIIGAGETPEKAEKIFYEILEDYFIDERKQAEKAKRAKGRPKKNNSKLTINIDYKTRAFVGLLAQSKGKTISNIIEEIAEHYSKTHPEENFGIL